MEKCRAHGLHDVHGGLLWDVSEDDITSKVMVVMMVLVFVGLLNSDTVSVARVCGQRQKTLVLVFAACAFHIRRQLHDNYKFP